MVYANTHALRTHLDAALASELTKRYAHMYAIDTLHKIRHRRRCENFQPRIESTIPAYLLTLKRPFVVVPLMSRITSSTNSAWKG
jgi:hypothetical protein